MLQAILDTLARRPPPHRIVDLDAARMLLWKAIQHLFPAHAEVTQTDNGAIAITWAMRSEGSGRRGFSAPILIRPEPGLILALWTSAPADRQRIAEMQEMDVRLGLFGYEPDETLPRARVIVLG